MTARPAPADAAPIGNGAAPVPPRPPRPAGPPGHPAPAGSVEPAGSAASAGGASVVADAALAELRRHARHLVAELPGPVRRVLLRNGGSVLEVEWHAPADPAAPGAPVAAPPAVSSPTAVPDPAHRPAVRSPVVGTFYRALEPGAAPFVSVGDVVRPGQVVGIVEAMKLMNEVTADQAGRVVELLVDDGQPVEYDQPLLALDQA